MRTVRIRALVELGVYRDWKALGTAIPKSFCANAGGPGTTIIDEYGLEELPEMVEVVRANALADDRILVRAEFAVPVDALSPETLKRHFLFQGRPR